MPKPLIFVHFVPTVRDGASPHAAMDSLDQLLKGHPDGICLSSFWGARGENLGSLESRPAGLDGFSGPPLGAGFKSDNLYCRLADAIHRARIPLLLSGRIVPEARSKTPLGLTGEGYHQLTRYALAHGRLAQKMGARHLVLGSHWGPAGPRLIPQEMRMILAAVRTVYKGSIIYGARLEELCQGLLWQSADAMALAGPVALSCRRKNPSQGLLSRTCLSLLRKVERLRLQYPKPFFITDVGYPTRAGGHQDPLGSRKSNPEPSLPVRAVRALHEAFFPKSWYRGLGVFAWGSHSIAKGDQTLALQGKSILPDLLSKPYSSRRKSK